MVSHNLILCGDHKLAPWSVVCVHLVEGTSKDWVPVHIEPQDRSHPDVENDWLCRECACLGEPPVQNLKAICIHCVRELQARAGYQTEGDTE
jgi:hypothetical protein